MRQHIILIQLLKNLTGIMMTPNSKNNYFLCAFRILRFAPQKLRRNCIQWNS